MSNTRRSKRKMKKRNYVMKRNFTNKEWMTLKQCGFILKRLSNKKNKDKKKLKQEKNECKNVWIV